MTKAFRQGATGAILDEYRKAISELQNLISNIPDDILMREIDSETNDVNCKSMQTILSHVVSSGYGYACSIYKLKGHNAERPDKAFHSNAAKYIQDLNAVFDFTETVFKDIKDDELEQFDDSLKIKTSWGQLYDIEQMMEHAIVHILRHRRQIERFPGLSSHIKSNGE